MFSSNHLIIVPSDYDIEDAFSSTNVLDYFPATPGNTSPDFSNDLTKYLLATLVFSPLHDDPYMEIMQACDATDNELSIPPLQEISPPKYIETHVESPIPISPSLSVGSSSPVRSTTPPPDYPFDKSIFAKCLLEYSSLEIIMEDIQMPPKRTSTSETPTMTQASIWPLIADGIAAALEAQAATMANTSRNIIIKKMEDKFYNLAVKENDLKTYVRRFQELAVLCPNMVPNTEKLMEVFIGGLPRSIEGNVTASKIQTLEEAIIITQKLMEQVLKHNSAQETNDYKRKFEDRRNTTDNNNYPNDRNNNNHSNNHNNDNYQNNHNNHNRNNDYHQQQNRRQETIRTYTATPN
ncbi:hypothetical protein Tco_0627492 [Tanacetum coccineum]|uniref:Reverse transcriptase domain-containing protein n=1 Tax=Tanacetum coccineum TaxID=301880 RepID=A0ABQ4WML8_9ASTR